MKRNKIIPAIAMVAALSVVAISGCVSSQNGGQGVQALEGMSDLQFSKWKLYVGLGTKIAAHRLLEEELTTEVELDLAATALETVRDQTIVPGATSLIMPVLAELGLTNEEMQLLLLIVEQELLARGALEWINPETGLIALSDRSKELLTSVADALRSATLVTPSEKTQATELQEELGGKIIRN